MSVDLVSARYRHWRLSVSNDSTVELCDVLQAVYFNVLRWPLDIMVKGLATSTVKFYGNFTQYLSFGHVNGVLENRKHPNDRSVCKSKFAPTAEMVHFWTAPVCKFPIGSRYICHTDVINIYNTNNLKSIQTLKTADFHTCKLRLDLYIYSVPRIVFSK